MAYILFLSRYYLPEKAAAAVCVSEMAQRLVTLGHQVTILTTVPNYPDGNVPPAYRGRWIQEEEINGVRVVRVWSVISKNAGVIRRILAQLSFGFTAPLLGGNTVGQPDMIIVGSPPLFNVIGARILARWKRSPLIFWVADLWPESAVQLGMLRNRTLIALAEWLEWSTYQRAALVWVVTRGMYARLQQRGLAAERLVLLTNGVDSERFHPQSRQAARAQLGWDDRLFTVLYTGTHGLSHGLKTVLDAAELLQEYRTIRFVLVGDGAEKAALIADAQRRGLQNVNFLDPVPHEQVPVLLAAADVCLAHTRKLQIFQGMLPMKMYEAMACGRPVILALDGEACTLAVEEAQAALYAEPENARALTKAVLHLFEQPAECALLGQRGRAYVVAHYDYAKLTQELACILEGVLTTQHNKKQDMSVQKSQQTVQKSHP